MIPMLVALLAVGASGQGSDAALRDRVGQLVEKLDAPKAEARDDAEKALIGLGEKALPLLPEPSRNDSERDRRLGRVRAALREAQEKLNLGASIVTIQVQGVRLSEAIRMLQKQSGNPLTDQRDEPANPSIDLDIKEKPFFEALEEVARKGGVGLNFTTNDGSIALVDPAAMSAPADPAEARPAGLKVLYPGPFRVVLKEFTAKRNFESGTAAANAQFEVDWEPRLRPMLLAWKAEDLKIVDDRGTAVAPRVSRESASVVLRPTNPSAELNINMNAPGREAKALASLKVKADVTVPAALRTFKFPKLTAKGVKQTQGDIAVTLESAEVEEGRWRVNIQVDYSGGGPAFESYQQGLFNNRLWLQRQDGSKFDHNGGLNQTESDGGRLGFEYFFVDVPGKPADYQFVYETPGKVETIPLEFEFKDVPLP